MFRPGRDYLIDVDTGDSKPVTPEGFTGDALSPDGKTSIVVGPDGKSGLFPLDGSGFRPIEGLQPGFVPFAWTPDGTSLYVAQIPGDRRHRKIFRINLATGKMDLWKTLGEGINSGVTNVSVAMFAKENSAYAYDWSQVLSQA